MTITFKQMIPLETNYKERLASVELVQTDNRFLLCQGDRTFRVAEPVYRLVEGLKQGLSLEQIQQQTSRETSQPVTTDALKAMVGQVMSRLEASPESPRSNQLGRSRYIYGRIRITTEEQLYELSRRFTWLFNKLTFSLLMVVSVAATLLFLRRIILDGGRFNITPEDRALLIIANYIFLAGISFVHEVGHATAAVRYGVRPKEVGFGFYFVFPVLYTDVSRIWRLDRWRRIVVNVGGIYFQLLINAALYGLSQVVPPEYVLVCKSLFLLNTFLAVYSLNPFLRNDGYWMYSDLFGLQNLTQRSLGYPVRLWQTLTNPRPATLRTAVTNFFRELPLTVYSLLHYTLMALLPVWLFRVSVDNFHLMEQIVANGGHLPGKADAETYIEILKTTVLYVLTVVITYRTARMLMRTFRSGQSSPAQTLAASA